MRELIPMNVVNTWGRTGPMAVYYLCSRTYPEFLGVRLVAGRYFTDSDSDPSSHQVIVTRDFAEYYWQTATAAIGHGVLLGHQERTIAGVVESIRNFSLAGPRFSAVYVPYSHDPPQHASFLVKAANARPGLAMEARNLIASSDKTVVVADARPLEAVVAGSLSGIRALSLFLTVLSLAALAITFLGIYGLVSFSVSQRNRELAIRRAFGANNRRVVGSVLKEAVHLAGVGLIPGLILAFFATRVLETILYGAVRVGWEVAAAVAVAVLATALAGALIPALRTVRIEPSTVLHHD